LKITASTFIFIFLNLLSFVTKLSFVSFQNWNILSYSITFRYNFIWRLSLKHFQSWMLFWNWSQTYSKSNQFSTVPRNDTLLHSIELSIWEWSVAYFTNLTQYKRIKNNIWDEKIWFLTFQKRNLNSYIVVVNALMFVFSYYTTWIIRHLSDNHNPLQSIQLSKANELVLNYI